MTARLGTGAPSPQSGPPSHGRCSLNWTPRRGWCPARGPRVNPRDTSTLSTRTGYLPNDLAPSLMPQLHDAMEQEPGGESFGTASVPTGPAPAHGRPGADTTFSGTARLDAQGLSTRAGDYHLSSAASGQCPRARPMHGTTTRKGAGPRRRVISSRCCSPGTARRGRYPPGSDTDPTNIAQWVSLR